jgi:hypothetical protein
MAQQDSSTNWFVVALGALIVAVAVLAVDQPLVRAVAVLVGFGLTIFFARAREEPRVENPLLDQLRSTQKGLDRRKYGRLRSTTDRLLENVRQMNRIAIDGREGRLSPRHAHAELERLAAVMRDIIDDCRKSAGVPTPVEEPDNGPAKVVPKVVLPKAQREAEEAAPREAAAEGQALEADETDNMLDELEARAEAEAAQFKEQAAEAGGEERVEEPEED